MDGSGLQERLDALSACRNDRLRAEADALTLERDYALWKRDATRALVGTPNPLTKRDHSLSSAEEEVCASPKYQQWTVKLDIVRGDLVGARLDYELALEALRTARVMALIEHEVSHV